MQEQQFTAMLADKVEHQPFIRLLTAIATTQRQMSNWIKLVL